MLHRKYFRLTALVLCIIFSSVIAAAPAYAAGSATFSRGISIISEDIEALSNNPSSYSWLLVVSIVCAVAAAVALTVLIVTTVTAGFVKRK